jgi:hypothetical protein
MRSYAHSPPGLCLALSATRASPLCRAGPGRLRGRRFGVRRPRRSRSSAKLASGARGCPLVLHIAGWHWHVMADFGRAIPGCCGGHGRHRHGDDPRVPGRARPIGRCRAHRRGAQLHPGVRRGLPTSIDPSRSAPRACRRTDCSRVCTASRRWCSTDCLAPHQGGASSRHTCRRTWMSSPSVSTPGAHEPAGCCSTDYWNRPCSRPRARAMSSATDTSLAFLDFLFVLSSSCI